MASRTTSCPGVWAFSTHPIELPNQRAFLNIESESARSEAIESLREKLRLYVFPTKVPDEICDELLKIALTRECTISLPSGEKTTGLYDRTNPKAVRYAIQPDTLLNQPAVQKLISDKSVIWLAQTYLGAKPVLDHLVMWWITNINKAPDSGAAQLYHFDMDKVKFLKLFLYLTDVGVDSGPHCYVKGPQKTGGIPAALLDRGYARLPDEDVKPFYRPGDMVEIGGPRGTIFAEDTRGLHKGKHLMKGDRPCSSLNSQTAFSAPHETAQVLLKIQGSNLPTLCRCAICGCTLTLIFAPIAEFTGDDVSNVPCDLVPIAFDDLAGHSVWPKRLLGLESFGFEAKVGAGGAERIPGRKVGSYS